MPVYETRKRSIVKTILWRIVATAITWSTIYFYTGALSESTRITFVAAAIGMLAYYIYERIWNRIIWERTEKSG